MSTDSSTGCIQEDNPCWGSPTKCDLKHLLSLFSKESTILYETVHYVVLNKPPDLRMDGPYQATVHKLLTYWYPPPSLLHTPPAPAPATALLDSIAQIHQYNSLSDNELRPCHQLDYATSGLLCVARTQMAANFAIRQWEERNVTKEYLAVVEGLISLDSSSLPRLTPTQIRSTLQSLERDYKKQRRPNKKSGTFQGFQPAHALFQKYKSFICKSQGKSTKKRPRPEILSEEQWDLIWKPVQETLGGSVGTNGEAKDGGIINKSIEGMGWKTFSQINVEWKRAFERAAEIHNNLLRDALKTEESSEDDIVFPTVFGEVLDDTTTDTTTINQIIYIACPLATDPNDFSMKVPPELLKQYPHMEPFVGTSELDYKPSLTKCTILSHDQGTTKVQLLPLTGRRHQLRVHMALVAPGKGILGDATYNPCTCTHDDLSSRKTAQRMCLHSYKLSLCLLVDDNKEEMIHLEAPDPF